MPGQGIWRCFLGHGELGGLWNRIGNSVWRHSSVYLINKAASGTQAQCSFHANHCHLSLLGTGSKLGWESRNKGATFPPIKDVPHSSPVPLNHLRSVFQAVSDPVSLRWDLGVQISSTLPGDMDPQTTLWVMRVWRVCVLPDQVTVITASSKCLVQSGCFIKHLLTQKSLITFSPAITESDAGDLHMPDRLFLPCKTTCYNLRVESNLPIISLTLWMAFNPQVL